jgi:hypothetical protein
MNQVDDTTPPVTHRLLGLVVTLVKIVCVGGLIALLMQAAGASKPIALTCAMMVTVLLLPFLFHWKRQKNTRGMTSDKSTERPPRE